jgi:RNA polymerase sigma-70 factor, ECF subfamily
LGISDDIDVGTPTPRAVDTREFAAFMHAYQDMVFSTAARLLANDAQAQDITQEVFLRAYERFDTLHDSPTAGGWLKTVATHLTLNHLSRYRRRWRLFSELARPDAEEAQPEPEELEPAFATLDNLLGEVDAEQRRILVARALEQLPEHQRVPLVLFHFEDMSYQQIAALLHVSLAKLKTDILRGRLALAKSLRELAPESAGNRVP